MAVAADGTIFVSALESAFAGQTRLFAIGESGEIKLVREGLGRGQIAIGANGTIYASTSSGVAIAMNPDGSTKWEYALPRVTGNTDQTSLTVHAPTMAGGCLFFSSGLPFERAALVAFDTNGNVVSGFQSLGSSMLTEDDSPFVGQNGVTFALLADGSRLDYASFDGNLIIGRFDRANAIKWLTPIQKPNANEFLQLVAVSRRGIVFLASSRSVVALDAGVPLAESAWSSQPIFAGPPDGSRRARPKLIASPLLSLSVSPEETRRLSLGTQYGRAYSVEFSDDANHWQRLTNFMALSQETTLVDQAGSKAAFRLYRALVP
jgi:hypothetical protein